MTNISRRQSLLALVAAAPAAGCYGSFNLTRKVYGWNGSFSSGILKELVFLGLIIIPVYGVAMLVDAFILNLIEFIAGSNPVSAKNLSDGHQVAFERLPDGKTFRATHYENGWIRRVTLIRRTEGGFELLDGEGNVTARAQATPQGGVSLLDGAGIALHELSTDELARLEDDLATRPLSQVIPASYDEPGARQRVASLRRGTLLLRWRLDAVRP